MCIKLTFHVILFLFFLFPLMRETYASLHMWRLCCLFLFISTCDMRNFRAIPRLFRLLLLFSSVRWRTFTLTLICAGCSFYFLLFSLVIRGIHTRDTSLQAVFVSLPCDGRDAHAITLLCKRTEGFSFNSPAMRVWKTSNTSLTHRQLLRGRGMRCQRPVISTRQNLW